jgi:DNA-binding transcriptional regulator YbjK
MLLIAEHRKHNAPERRRQLADAAIELLGAGGARGLSHPKVDVHAGVPAGTASFYFRTRQALLLGIAERLTELDVQDLSRLTELATDGSGQFTGTAGLAELVMYSAAEPFLTRTKARYELALHASRDAELMSALRLSVDTFYRLAHDVVARWHPETDAPPADLIDEQARAALALINGIMLSFVAGRPIVQSAAQLEHLLDGLIAGLTTNRGP